ncbi:hypothetical protein V491_01498 [Pseudogymnoascus sp. VKM F-3775]|nr:hypothetical protein V491_01498 [Pseudogymnoascus sp. VKM F-3775]
MGIAASRQLEAHLHAVNSAESPNLLFEDDTILKALTKIWKLVPNKHKSKFTSTRPRSKRTDRLPKLRSTTSITLDPSIKEEYKHWKDDPSTILQHIATPLDSLPKHPIPNTYHQLVRLEKQNAVNLILHRFLCVRLHRLKLAFQTQKIRATTRRDFQSLILESGLAEPEKAKVAGNLERWIRAGGRYLAIANRLGGIGALMLLPDDISLSVWEEYLPSTGTEFENMMTHLKHRGICREAIQVGANDVAAGIERVIGDDWSFCQFTPGRSANSLSDRQSTNGTEIAPTTRAEANLSPVTGGDHAQMTGWLGSQTAGEPVDRGATFSHTDDSIQSELGHFHTESSTRAAEALTFLRQTALQHKEPNTQGWIDERMEVAQHELLDPRIEINPTTSFNYYDPSTFSEHYSAHSIPTFPFHSHDPNTFSQFYGSPDLSSFPFDSTHDPNNFSTVLDMNSPILSN